MENSTIQIEWYQCYSQRTSPNHSTHGSSIKFSASSSNVNLCVGTCTFFNVFYSIWKYIQCNNIHEILIKICMKTICQHLWILLHFNCYILFYLGLPWWLRRLRICLQCGRPKFDFCTGKIPWRSEFLPGKSHGQRSLVGYSPWGHKKSNMTEKLTHTYKLYSILWLQHSSFNQSIFAWN